MGKIVGIDLGTTNSVVAFCEGDQPTVIANDLGARLTPSVVAFMADGSRVVGVMAKRQAVQNPQRTVSSIKRFMGRRHAEVPDEAKRMSYPLVGNGQDLVKVRIDGKDYTPPEISALILADLKKSAETYFGEPVTEAVITVPAYFNDGQRQATKDAGEIAGLNVRRILNEPTAAALAFGLDKSQDHLKFAVFDFGGGTFDISILELNTVDGDKVFEVKATNGDTRLGGDDVDEALLNYLADDFMRQHRIDLRQDAMALQRLREAAEKAKCELSTMPQTAIALPFITVDSSKTALHLNQQLTRARFEEIVKPVLDRLAAPCLKCLEDAKLKPADLSEVVMVGGSSRIPRVQQIVQELFGREGNRTVNPDEVVAVGAAVQARLLAGTSTPGATNMTFIDVTPLTLGVEIDGRLMHPIIPRNTVIPCSREEDNFTTSTDNQTLVEIKVFQGERPLTKDNRLLGHFKLTGIPPAPRGVPKFKVKFDIDQNGILNVSASELHSGLGQNVTIESSSGLDRATVERLRREADQHAEEDRVKREEAEFVNAAEALVYSATRSISDFGTRLPAELREQVTKAVAGLRSALDKKELPPIRTAKAALDALLVQASTHIYGRSASPTPPPPNAPTDKKGPTRFGM